VFGHSVELLSRVEHTGKSERIASTAFCRRSQRCAQSGALRDGTSRGASRAGAVLVPGVAVTALQRTGPGWTVTTTAGSVSARDVLVATNACYDARAEKAATGDRRSIIATEPLTDAQASRVLPTGRMAYDSKQFLYYFRLTSTVVCCSADVSFTQASAHAEGRADLHRGLVAVPSRNVASDYVGRAGGHRSRTAACR
jgi:glycine/D-amino acid oxidase-like deaminating enzyme